MIAGKFGLKAAILVLSGVILVSGCAKSPESIAPSYISEVRYQDYTCKQLGNEQARLVVALARASTQQSAARSNDILGVLLIGLPVSSLSGDNIAPEVARLKGERDAVYRAGNLKNCNITPASAKPKKPPPAPVAPGQVVPFEKQPLCSDVGGYGKYMKETRQVCRTN